MYKIIFEDQNLLLIDKPAGIVTVAYEENPPNQETLFDILDQKYNLTSQGGGVAHRLDKDTSGLLLVAKNAQTLEKLQSQFKNRQIKKEYLALVHGSMGESGEIEVSLSRNPKDRLKFTVSEEGRESKTGYKSEKYFEFSQQKLDEILSPLPKHLLRKTKGMNYNEFTLVRCFPLTGRTHQIRVHLKYLNHPIVSDQKYGGRKVVRLDLLWCPRQFLHAAKLEFIHPFTEEKLVFESPLPQDLSDPLKLLLY